MTCVLSIDLWLQLLESRVFSLFFVPCWHGCVLCEKYSSRRKLLGIGSTISPWCIRSLKLHLLYLIKVAYVIRRRSTNLSREGAACNEVFQQSWFAVCRFFGSFLCGVLEVMLLGLRGFVAFHREATPLKSSKCFALELHPFNCFLFCEVRMLWNLKLSSNKVISWGSLNNDVSTFALLSILFKSGKSSCQEQSHLVLFSFSCPTKFPTIFFSPTKLLNRANTTNLPSSEFFFF